MWSGTVREFIDLARSGRLTAALRRDLARQNQSVSSYEEGAWDRSLPVVAEALEGAGLDMHYLQIIAEVALPGTSSRADIIMLGSAADQGRGVVIVELKQWSGSNVRGSNPEMVEMGPNFHKLHPCAQVQGYRDYLRLYAAALVDRTPASTVVGCAYLHNLDDTKCLGLGNEPRAEAINRALVQECPAFGKGEAAGLVAYIKHHLPQPPSTDFVSEFANLEKRASRQVVQSFREVLDSNRNPWVLLDYQRTAMSHIQDALLAVKNGAPTKRRVLIVTGGPGSGKTVLAMSTLMSAFAEFELGQTYLVTTSSAQHTTISGELSLAKGERLAPTRKVSREPVRKASDLRIKVPKLQTSMKSTGMSQAAWDSYCHRWREWHDSGLNGLPDADVIIIDEAQGLVHPLRPNVDGSQANSWRKSFGPQAWHIMMRARLSIFFMDGNQGYRQVESTLPEDIEEVAREEGIDVVRLELGTEQFRVSGGWPYIAWLDRLLGFSDELPPVLTPTEAALLGRTVQLASHPGHMRDELANLYRRGEKSTRLLAGYAWEWASKDDSAKIDSHSGLVLPGRLAPPGLRFRWADKDFQREFNLGSAPYDNERGLFGVGDSLPAITGYPLTVRGRDIDHVGVLWGADLVWRNGHWLVNHKLVFGSDMPSLRKAAREEVERGTEYGPFMQALVRAVAGGYRILLTRAMKTVRVWIEDEETASYVSGEWRSYLQKTTQVEDDLSGSGSDHD